MSPLHIGLIRPNQHNKIQSSRHEVQKTIDVSHQHEIVEHIDDNIEFIEILAKTLSHHQTAKTVRANHLHYHIKYSWYEHIVQVLQLVVVPYAVANSHTVKMFTHDAGVAVETVMGAGRLDVGALVAERICFVEIYVLSYIMVGVLENSLSIITFVPQFLLQL